MVAGLLGGGRAVSVSLFLGFRDGDLEHQPLGLGLVRGVAHVVGEGVLGELELADAEVLPDTLLRLGVARRRGVLPRLRLPRRRLPPAAVVGRAPRRPVPSRVPAAPRRQEVPGIVLAPLLVPFCVRAVRSGSKHDMKYICKV